eukprot:TRINITY_DN7084_c0_g1_i1.p1 TRINITY_DN7084_c0_g1~~TRINITY_DN7084_c0_g1_i1.p1  ORF type:complete len:183 (+),score=44.25 TRINITY_DN7084_c0_g1_i1:156-704(+)
MQQFELPKEMKEKARGRQDFKFNGETIYQWEQDLDDIHIYITPPKFILPKYRDEIRKQLQPGEQLPLLEVKIDSQHVMVKIKGNDSFYLNNDLENKCNSKESLWMLEDEELHIQLQKLYKGEIWKGVFQGHGQVDSLTEEELKKKVMLERFQEEHPGFDFSSAEFNGMAPDPRTFMGGISYK